ncbi:ABC transporter substrate-binding protein/permease [Nocardioides sp. zg-1308]|uniref:ABC transporter substrate-binding protein/permease n=1 Tax=Nocardioides sp. zg-1308 TaxID=2736253 RepID=UPI001557F2BC|nr:ABC transporter substrate-binding protein/permease [Nocardioides sp. zg-1308]NPD05107.1 ABC transporter substrate-binding protein/permease [Nocardioides sp. zg-1308]
MQQSRRALALVVLSWFVASLALTGGAASAESTGTPAEARTVRVGTEGTYPPFTFHDPGTDELTGFDIEVIRAVADEAGWDLEFVEAPFDSIFPALDAGRVDVIANQITINPEREARYLFSTPYTYSRGVIVTAAGNDDVRTLDDIDGLVAAESETSNWAQVARDAGAEIRAVDQFAQAAELLVQGRVDVVVNDNIAVLDYLASTGSDEIEIVGDAGEDVGQQALTFRQDSPELQQEADDALARLADDGTLADISEDYFGADVTVEDAAEVTDVRGSDTRSTAEVVRGAAWPMLKGLLVYTLPLTVASFAIGLVLALVTALARMSSNRLVQLPARVYISAIRGTPLLVQLFIVFYGLGQIGLTIPPVPAAIIALSLNVGGYAAEIIRGSILSVPRGQYEAATTIGMRYPQLMRRIVLPQAARIAVPPLSNTLLSLIKDTSLASVILVPELLRRAINAASPSADFMPLYLFAALYYWIVCFIVAQAQEPLERRLGRYAA